MTTKLTKSNSLITLPDIGTSRHLSAQLPRTGTLTRKQKWVLAEQTLRQDVIDATAATEEHGQEIVVEMGTHVYQVFTEGVETMTAIARNVTDPMAREYTDQALGKFVVGLYAGMGEIFDAGVTRIAQTVAMPYYPPPDEERRSLLRRLLE